MTTRTSSITWLDQFFEGDEYKTTRSMLAILKRDFPEKYAGLVNQQSRVEEWKRMIDSGERDDDQTRDDIAKYIIGPDLLASTYGISIEEADRLILGGNEGGINFSELGAAGTGGTAPGAQDAGGLEVSPGAPSEESVTEEGIGIDDGDDSTPDMTILTSDEMKWFFDRASGKWYVEYGLPNSDRNVIFEAEPDQLDALFGDGYRPSDYTARSLKDLVARAGSTFAGNIAEVEGTGTFESEVNRVTTLALDEGKLPDWALQDGVALDIIFTAQSEGKSDEWVLDQLSKTDGFKQRFPGMDKFTSDNNISLAEGVTGFLEFEAGVDRARRSIGQSGETDPELVGQLLTAGHSLTDINNTVNGFKRMREFQPAMDAFNQILAAQGADPITDIESMFDFVTGKAPAEVYDLWEASSIAEAAVGAGLGDVFSAEDALAAAASGTHTLQTASAAMSKAAEMLLRLRHEVDTNKFGLDTEDLIDLSLGQTPRSGKPESEIMENVNRAVLSAQGDLKKRASSFKQFGSSGQVQAASLRGLRQGS